MFDKILCKYLANELYVLIWLAFVISMQKRKKKQERDKETEGSKSHGYVFHALTGS
jgi:hypothetical protein